MAKALKTVAVIVGVAVAGFATAGAAWAIAGGTAVGAAVAGAGATSIFGIATASQVISGSFLVAGLAGAVDKPSTPTVGVTDAGTQIEFKADPRAPIPLAFGRTGTGGNLVFDDTAGDKSKYLNQVIVWSLGPVQEIEAIFVNDLAVGFPGDGGEGQTGFWNGHMWCKNQLGEPGSPLLVSATVKAAGGVPSEWTDAHRLSGYAASWTTQLYDTTIYSGGPVTWRANVKGVFAWDPRLDGTYPGGFGSCRLADPSTWVWSENPYVHGLKWCLGVFENGKRVMGVGAPLAAIDVAAFVQGANVADANGWKVGGVVYSSDDKWEVLKAVLQAGGGVPLKQAGLISCFVNTPRVSLATITGDDVADDVSITATQPKLSRINTVWPTWRQEAQNWQVAAGDAPIQVTDYFDVDAGERSTDITYQLVQDADQVAQLARYDIEDSREFGPVTLPCKPKWLGYRPGDCITADEPEWGLTGQKLLILSRQIDPSSLVVTLTCRSETDGKHPYALGQTQQPPSTPGLTGAIRLLTAPEEGAWTAAAEILDGADGEIPAILVTGQVDNPQVAEVIVGWAQVVDDVAQELVEQGFPANATRIDITAVAPGETYEVRVRYRMVGGATDPGLYFALGRVTVGGLIASGVRLIDGLTPAQVLQKIADVSDQGTAALQAAMDLANTASQALLDAKSIRDRIAAAGFTIDGVPLGPMAQELRSQGDDLVYDRTLLGLRSATQQAFILNDNTVQFTNGDTIATRMNLLYAADATNAAAVQSEATSRANADTAESTARLTLAATVSSNYATYSAFASSQATTNSSTSSSITSLTSTVASNYSAFTTSQTTQAGVNSATASSLTALSGTVGGNSASITSLLSITSGLGSQAVLSLDYNGNVAGYRFANGASGSSLVFVGGAIGFTDGTGAVYPLTVAGGNVRISSLIVDQVAANTITTAHLVGGAVNAVGGSDSAPNSVIGTSFASATTLGVTSSGGKHEILCSIRVSNTNTADAVVVAQLLRDGAYIDSAAANFRGGFGLDATFQFFDTPGAGGHTYDLQVERPSSAPSVTCTRARILNTEFKKAG